MLVSGQGSSEVTKIVAFTPQLYFVVIIWSLRHAVREATIRGQFLAKGRPLPDSGPYLDPKTTPMAYQNKADHMHYSN